MIQKSRRRSLQCEEEEESPKTPRRKGSSREAAAKSAQKKPKAFVQPTKSNKTLIRNALIQTCLAGLVNEHVKKQVLEDLDESNARHFVILFRETNNFSFRGLYFWDPELDQTVKLYSGSMGPTGILH
jgi:Microtubule-binding calmodulin-regulated spectrin-associated